ncbi:hypothetical protein SAMN05216299_102120 [Nitrosospira sp. Nsp14]|uniref:DUF2946 family protein n=1 Tax=Nitrosospira sp. Nsp14 TaxID=1855333 RepID=UPI0008F3B879|nr:DUF2946 family protein [Nitrosospira sp. Nsp14]SFH19204.1 hypothetical protein SAMN05216299_102120 [Nitrosospira sp. Nsp14]
MILRKLVKALFFLLLLVLALVPVLQAAHALTHIAPDETGGIAQSSDGRFVGIVASEAEAEASATVDADLDSDRICLDCLALAAFGLLLPALAFCFFDQARRQLLSDFRAVFVLISFSSPYLTRAPPRS